MFPYETGRVNPLFTRALGAIAKGIGQWSSYTILLENKHNRGRLAPVLTPKPPKSARCMAIFLLKSFYSPSCVVATGASTNGWKRDLDATSIMFMCHSLVLQSLRDDSNLPATDDHTTMICFEHRVIVQFKLANAAVVTLPSFSGIAICGWLGVGFPCQGANQAVTLGHNKCRRKTGMHPRSRTECYLNSPLVILK